MLCLCWGYWIPTCLYGGRPYLVHGLLNYSHHRTNWVPEPHTTAKINISSKIIKIKGTFRHDQCRQVSTFNQAFDKLTYLIYSGIP